MRELIAFGLLMGATLWASEPNRVYLQKEIDGETVKLIDDKTSFKLLFKADEKPVVLMTDRGKKPAMVFNFFVEHRTGVGVLSDRLVKGDILLEPLRTPVDPDIKKSVVLLREGTVMDEENITYVKNNTYRVYFNEEGDVVAPTSFKAGDILDLWEKKIKIDGEPEYVESGLRTPDGKVIIENGTKLEKHHVKMLVRAVPMPVKIRHTVDLNLDVYLRTNWPDRVPENKDRYWVKREGIQQPLHLLAYQIKEGDVPYADIKVADGTLICKKGNPIRLKGARDSIEALDDNPNAFMHHKGKLIYSIDPISGLVNTYRPEPGELILSPVNEHTFVNPIFIKNEDEFNRFLNDTTSAYAYAHNHEAKLKPFKEGNDGDEWIPFYIHRSYYPIPFMKDCIGGCDQQFNVLDYILKDKHYCKTCRQHSYFKPYVMQEVPLHPYQNQLYKAKPIMCGHCDLRYMYNESKQKAGDLEDGADLPKQKITFVHPSRLLKDRLGKKVIEEQISYFKNGEEIIIEKGSEITDEMKKEIEDRAITPVFVDKPSGVAYNASQCPRCFGWNNEPLNSFQLKQSIGVDEIRKGAVAFPVQSRRLNKIELVVFGLSSEIEPTSGRELAHVTTYRRHGDEHFLNVSHWEKTKEEWKYLPRYKKDAGMRMPVAIGSEGGSSDDDLDF